MSDVSVNTGKDSFLPDYLLPAHNLCFLNHDVLLELLRSGEEKEIFSQEFNFSDETDQGMFHSSKDIFEWFEHTGRINEQAEFIKRIVFPALLSDLLHFIYETLENSRKAKLNVAYALVRKPIQENLLLFEVIALNPNSFARYPLCQCK